MKDKNVIIAATGFYAGYFPFAPGTAGSIAALPFCVAITYMPSWLHTCMIAAIILLSIWISDKAEKIIGSKDPSCIVIDEAAGLALAFAGIQPDLFMAAAGFVFFRLFDIIKPWPLKNLEKIFSGGAGITADDIGAGIYAAAALNLLLLVRNAWF